MTLYRSESLVSLQLYVKTGEFRPPRKGEWFLSGAIPEAYRAFADLDTPFHIMRPATEAEMYCQHCGQRLPADTDGGRKPKLGPRYLKYLEGVDRKARRMMR